MDSYKLEYELKTRGLTVRMLCEELGISRSAYYRKTHGLSEFTLSEIQHIVDFLNLDSPMGIFFANRVS